MFQKLLEFFTAKEVSGTEVYYTPTLAGNLALFLVVLLLFLAMAILSKSRKRFDVRQLAFSAMAVTLTVVTSFLKVWSLPFGGSITLFSMFFICFIGFLYGASAGILAGIAYGFINLILGPTILHPIQMLLDYPIAFGCLGLSGIFANSKYGIVKGYILGVFGRYVCHVLTGVIFFHMYAPKEMNVFLYSLGYNATYIIPELIITILILLIPAVQNGLKEVKGMVIQNRMDRTR